MLMGDLMSRCFVLSMLHTPCYIYTHTHVYILCILQSTCIICMYVGCISNLSYIIIRMCTVYVHNHCMVPLHAMHAYAQFRLDPMIM